MSIRQACPECYAAIPELREHAPLDCPDVLDAGALLGRYEHTTKLRQQLRHARQLAAVLAGVLVGTLLTFAAF